METDTLTKEEMQMQAAMSREEIDTCNHCGNMYNVNWIKSGDDYNDFGERYCPFCGLLSGEHY